MTVTRVGWPAGEAQRSAWRLVEWQYRQCGGPAFHFRPRCVLWSLRSGVWHGLVCGQHPFPPPFVRFSNTWKYLDALQSEKLVEVCKNICELPVPDNVIEGLCT